MNKTIEPFAVVIIEPPESEEMLREFLHHTNVMLSNKPKGQPFALQIHPEVIADRHVQSVLKPFVGDAYVVGGVPF